MTRDTVPARIRDLHQVEALLAWAQEQYREQLTAWLARGGTEAPPLVPESYRQLVARLQVALGHLNLALEQRAAAPPPATS